MVTTRRRRRAGSTKKADQKKGKRKAAKKGRQERRTMQKVYNQSAISGGSATAPTPEIRPSFHEAIIGNIVHNSNGGNVPDEAVLLSSTLSSLSSGMKTLNYRFGVSAGRSLYRIGSAGKTYTDAMEPVADLARFFESAGYKHVTYRAYPGDVEIKIHESNGADVGTNVHSFEAGLVAGYLNAAGRKYVDVAETACANNGSRNCTFSIRFSAKENRTGAGAPSIDRLVNHITEQVKRPLVHMRKPHISGSYYSLSSPILFDSSYTGPLKDIAAYMGRGIGERLFGGKKSGRAFFSYLENAIRLLNLGDPTIMSANPLHMQVRFDKLTSRREFVDLSLAFINGLITERFGSEFTAQENSSNGSYVLDIREAK